MSKKIISHIDIASILSSLTFEEEEKMINISYLYIAIVLLAIWTIYRILVLKKSKDKNSFRELIINIKIKLRSY